MGTTDVLRSSIHHSQDRLVDRLADARSMEAPPDRPREGHARIDAFLSSASKHLHAVDEVLLQPTRRGVPDGGPLVHDYLRSVKDLEVVLAHVKAHEYGSVYETSFSWPEVWGDVEHAMTDHHRHEAVLGDRLSDTLDDEELQDLAQRLYSAELAAPSRPHPYTPHTGLFGAVARKVMHTADRFWDTVEGRMVPEPVPPPKKKPGLVAQYFLADPRFDEEERRPRP
ncbi:hypothetical protein [Nocardioides sp. YIM 152315]|uniref:hypothetical protein n=1 Tax=Nocardioides sp. YIM 152315 TaxID=3031760 RepID=UPI0023DA7F32|nr:hypothetical protein [Nocardioides sp. YIM 152315]MDF1602152.1 hypothetical protein [Nocardioides sp. YIM 152315]